MKSLIIGGATGYGWNELKYWVNSIKRSGFDGDICLVSSNITQETIEKLMQEGVKLSLYGKKQPDGSYRTEANNAPHVERFFYLWNTLNTIKEEYEFVVTTDTRDVVFQSDPIAWLKSHLSLNVLVASSEGLKYKDEPWGNRNLQEAFGPFFHAMLKDRVIYNVGTIAGDFHSVRDLLLMIFQMSINRPIPVVDQAVYNFLLSNTWFSDLCLMTNNKDSWAIQLGTTLEAVKSGKGDLGMIYGSDPSKHIAYQIMYDDDQPEFNDGFVVNKSGEKYCIVHQYDRTVSWTKQIMEKYDD